MDEEAEVIDDVASLSLSSFSLFPGGQSPMVAPETSMHVKLKSGISGHVNLMFVKLGARPQININSSWPWSDLQITGKIVVWLSFVVVYHVFPLTLGKLICSVETPLAIVVTVAVITAEETLMIGGAWMDVSIVLVLVTIPEVWLWSFCEELGSEPAVINGLGVAFVEFSAKPLLNPFNSLLLDPDDVVSLNRGSAVITANSVAFFSLGLEISPPSLLSGEDVTRVVSRVMRPGCIVPSLSRVAAAAVDVSTPSEAA